MLASNEKLASVWIVICQTPIGFRDRIGYVPCQPEIESQVLGYSPIILDKRPVDFPAPPTDRSVECLVVLCQARYAEQKIRLRISGYGGGTVCEAGEVPAGSAAGNPESVLEGFRADIHLICANADAELNVVLSANHIKRVIYRENVGSTLKGGVAAIAKGPVAAS